MINARICMVTQLYRSIKPFLHPSFFLFLPIFGTDESYKLKQQNERDIVEKLNADVVCMRSRVARELIWRARRYIVQNVDLHLYVTRYKHIYIDQSNKYLSFSLDLACLTMLDSAAGEQSREK